MAPSSDNAAVPESRTGLLSLPDEVLQSITALLAGHLRFTWESCSRDGISTGDLHQLCLVNRRISRIVRAELYRTPNALTKQGRHLSSDDLDILLKPETAQFAQTLRLAGTSRFFAGLFESRFGGLTALTLVFGIPQLKTAQNASVVAHKSLTRLREALRALPLLELHVHLQAGLVLSERDLHHIALLGAGHACLRRFYVDGPHNLVVAPSVEDSPIQSSGHTSLIIALSVRGFRTDHARIVRRALGYFPRLADIAFAIRGEDDSTAATVVAFTSGITDQITCFELQVQILGPLTWQSLAALSQLRTLQLYGVKVSGEDHWPDICLPKLRYIFTAADCQAYAIGTLLFQKAFKRQLLPRLQHIYITRFRSTSHPDARRIGSVHAMIAAYDKLLEERQDVQVTPRRFREELIKKLQALEARNGDEPGA